MHLSLFILLLLFIPAFPYEYYTLAQEVPATICKTRKCQKSMELNLGSKYLNLHGLWPDTFNPNDRPFDCEVNNYDEQKIENNILAEMDKVWVGLYNSTFWFRSHEWGKHGTCWNGDESQQSDYYTKMNNFLRKTLEVKRAINLDALIFNGQQVQNIGFSDLRNKIASTYHISKFLIHCQKINNVQYLDCVNLCLDLNYQPIDCPGMIIKCDQNKEVIIPDWTPNLDLVEDQ